jgi:two-component SAPR family response regulator
MKKLKAVLLDDDPFIHEIIEDLMRGSSLVEIVGWFSCPKKFLMAGIESKYDLYVLDIVMPHVNGFMIAERLKSRPFIFITEVSVMLQDAIELGPVDIVMKPIRKERLDSAFEKAYKLQGKSNQDLQKKSNCFMLQELKGKLK